MAKNAKRRYNRYVKGMRRIKEDRAEHGSTHDCACFDKEADRGKGMTFSQFADNPKMCSKTCCGNPRRHWRGKDGLTMQELKAPKVDEW